MTTITIQIENTAPRSKIAELAVIIIIFMIMSDDQNATSKQMVPLSAEIRID